MSAHENGQSRIDEETPVPLGQLALVAEQPAAAAEQSREAKGAPTSASRRIASASSCTAAEVTSERMLRGHAEAPPSGWRRAVYLLSGGAVNLGPSSADVERRELIARVKAPVSGCRRVAVVSRKGGVGKTTTTLMLGHTFAAHRGDRVIAFDLSPVVRSDSCERFSRPGSWTRKEPIAREAQQAYAGADHSQAQGG